MFGVIRETLEREGGSMRVDEDFFSVARTMPLVASDKLAQVRIFGEDICLPLIPNDVTPWLTAFNAYSVCDLISM